MTTPSELRRTYILSAAEKISRLDLGWNNLLETDWGAEATHEIRHQAHRLAGSGGSYGFPQISEAAHRLETLLVETPVAISQRPAVEAAYRLLRDTLADLRTFPEFQQDLT